MATSNGTTPKPLRDIASQHRKVRRLHEQVRDETRKLAEMIAATTQDPDPDVNRAAAARAMGVEKSYAYELVRKLDGGKV